MIYASSEACIQKPSIMIRRSLFSKPAINSREDQPWDRGSVMGWEAKIRIYPLSASYCHADQEIFSLLLPGIGEMVFSTRFIRAYICNPERTRYCIFKIPPAPTNKAGVKCLNI